MKKSDTLLIMLIIALGTFGIVTIAHYFITTVDVKDMEMNLNVGNKIGINIDSDKIWFGTTNPGGSSKREIVITNNRDFPVIIKFLPLGELQDYISLSENNFVLEPNERRQVGISVAVPRDMPYGNYTGTLRTVVKKQCVLFC